MVLVILMFSHFLRQHATLDHKFIFESIRMSKVIEFYTHRHDFNMAFTPWWAQPLTPAVNQEGPRRAAGLQRDRVLLAAVFAREQWPSEGLQGAQQGKFAGNGVDGVK